MKEISRVNVYYKDNLLGTLQQTGNGAIAFAYSNAWLRDGFSISPLSLPLQPGVFVPEDPDLFGGLYGVFADSLPDGWGLLLMDRMLEKSGIPPASVGTLTRLALVGENGRGALTYRPALAIGDADGASNMNLDALASECLRIFDGRATDQLDAVYRAGGSSGGARPKANFRIDGCDWIVKFPCSSDCEGSRMGVAEVAYISCARRCGIVTPETRLLASRICPGYFATRRFDRTKEGGRVHMVSVSGLLECSHRIPCLDYHALIQLTGILTHSAEDSDQLFRLGCFNFEARNTDDHARNFSFLFDDRAGRWQLAPAYDLAPTGPGLREHMTSFFGEGSQITERAIRAATKAMHRGYGELQNEYANIRDTCQHDLGMYIARRT